MVSQFQAMSLLLCNLSAASSHGSNKDERSNKLKQDDVMSSVIYEELKLVL